MRIIIKTFIITFLITLFVFTCNYSVAEPPKVSKVISFHSSANSEEPELQHNTLPSSLQIIGEEAFEGTAIIKVDLPESLTTLEDRAFANTKNLRNIYIPRSTTEIGKDVFAGAQHVSITAAPGSYARNWAKNNGIPFVTQVVFYASSGTVQISGYQINEGSKNKAANAKTIDIPKCSEAKGRTEGDIIAAKHEEYFAFSLQGRSPPMKG